MANVSKATGKSLHRVEQQIPEAAGLQEKVWQVGVPRRAPRPPPASWSHRPEQLQQEVGKGGGHPGVNTGSACAVFAGWGSRTERLTFLLSPLPQAVRKANTNNNNKKTKIKKKK